VRQIYANDFHSIGLKGPLQFWVLAGPFVDRIVSEVSPWGFDAVGFAPLFTIDPKPAQGDVLCRTNNHAMVYPITNQACSVVTEASQQQHMHVIPPSRMQSLYGCAHRQRIMG
jgi:hypothetical protein